MEIPAKDLRFLAAACRDIAECGDSAHLPGMILHSCARVFEADQLALIVLSPQSRSMALGSLRTLGIADEFVRMYGEHYGSVDPFVRYPGRPSYSLDEVKHACAPGVSEFLLDFLRPQGISDGLLVWAQLNGVDVAVVGACRERGRIAYGDRHVAMGEILGPLIASALWERAWSDQKRHVGGSMTLEERAPSGVLAMLTPREQELALLVAQGMCNKEIAARLCLSVLTVESRLKSMYRKTGISGRTRLALATKDAARHRGVVS